MATTAVAMCCDQMLLSVIITLWCVDAFVLSMYYVIMVLCRAYLGMLYIYDAVVLCHCYIMLYYAAVSHIIDIPVPYAILLIRLLYY